MTKSDSPQNSRFIPKRRVKGVAAISVIAMALVGSGASLSSAATATTTKKKISKTKATTKTTTKKAIAIKQSSTATTAAIAAATATTVAARATATTVAAASTASTGLSAGKSWDNTAGAKATQWSSNVKITYGASNFTFESNGLPSHELPDQFLYPSGVPTNPNVTWTARDTKTYVKGSNLKLEIPSKPTYSATVTKTSLGAIGVMISGVQMFNDYEDMNMSVVALDHAKTLTPVGGAAFIDACNGHPLMDGSTYHYHGIPYCITDALDVAGQHSKILGFLRDGFPIYGPQDVGGKKLTNADLDECSGHFGPTTEFPNGIYHYHLTDDKAPYSIDCYHGVVSATSGGGQGGGGARQGGGGQQQGGQQQGGQRPGGGQRPDLTSAATKLGVTVAQLEAALGQPPFDLAAAAKKLNVTVAVLQAALPQPPQMGGGAGQTA